MIRLILIFSFLLIIMPAPAQEMLGAVNSNYAGINAVQLNPANMLSQQIYLDINMLSGDAFIQNNAFYISKKTYYFFDLFTKKFSFTGANEGRYSITYRNNNDDNYLYGNLRLTGPSVMVVKEPHAFCLSTSFR